MNDVLIEINKDFKSKFIKGLPIDVYHADKTKLNSSLIRHMEKSPYAFKFAYLNNYEEEETNSMKFGTLMHMAVLEGSKFLERYVVEPEFLGFTKEGKISNRSGEAQEKKKMWHLEMQAQKKLIVTQKEYDKMRWMLDSFLNHKDAVELLKGGIGEITGQFADPRTGIVCRIRPDFLSFNAKVLIEFKTVTNASYDYFLKRRVEHQDYRYDLQLATYKYGLECITGGKVEMAAFIALESEPPFECAVYEIPDNLIDLAQMDLHSNLYKIKKCIESKEWPPMQQSTQWLFPSDYNVEKKRTEIQDDDV